VSADPIVETVIDKYRARSAFGQDKYRKNLMRDDVDFLGWMNHLQQELMDATLYLQRLIYDEIRRRDDGK
jgi:hypothetical protein